MIPENEITQLIAGHRRRNADLLKTLESKSVPTGEPRVVEHHFWAPTRKAAAFLARELYGSGYFVTAVAPGPLDSGGRWSVEIAVQQAPDDAASDRTVERLTRLAAQFDAVYDGWGTSV